jgi:hypothetical protein
VASNFGRVRKLEPLNYFRFSPKGVDRRKGKLWPHKTNEGSDIPDNHFFRRKEYRGLKLHSEVRNVSDLIVEGRNIMASQYLDLRKAARLSFSSSKSLEGRNAMASKPFIFLIEC